MKTLNTTSPFNPYGLHFDAQKVGMAMLWTVIALMLITFAPSAHAQSTFNIDFIDKIGCNIVKWMKGPLAVLIFIVVIIAVLIVGLIAKMDWARIITVAVVFGIVQGIFVILATTGIIIPSGCTSGGAGGLGI